MTTYTTSMVHIPRISLRPRALAASLALLALALTGSAMADDTATSRIDEMTVTAPAPAAGLRAHTLTELRTDLVEADVEKAPSASELARQSGTQADEALRAEFAAETRRVAESAVRLPTAMRAVLLASPLTDTSSAARM